MKRARSEEQDVEMENDNNSSSGSSEKGSNEGAVVKKDEAAKKPKEEYLTKPEVIEAHIEFVHASMREVMRRFHDVCVAPIGEGPDKSSVETARTQLQEGWKAMMGILNGILDDAKTTAAKSTKDDSDKLLKEFQTVVEGIDENVDWTCPICASAFDDQLCIPCKPAENYGEPYNSRYPENERSVVPPTCKHTLCQNCSSSVIANEVSCDVCECSLFLQPNASTRTVQEPVSCVPCLDQVLRVQHWTARVHCSSGRISLLGAF